MCRCGYINKRLESPTELTAAHDAESSISSLEEDENDFFFSKKKTGTSELQLFLDSHNEELSAYVKWPKPRELFIELNTPVPASAACERLFSCTGLILRPHRCSMTDKNFENSLLLKLNKGFL